MYGPGIVLIGSVPVMLRNAQGSAALRIGLGGRGPKTGCRRDGHTGCNRVPDKPHAVARLIPHKAGFVAVGRGPLIERCYVPSSLNEPGTLPRRSAEALQNKGPLLRGHGFLNRADGPTFLHQTLMNILF